MNVRWVYGSGVLDGDDGEKYAVSAVTFWAATEWKPVSHLAYTRLSDRKFESTAIPTACGDFVITPESNPEKLIVRHSMSETVRLVSTDGTMSGTLPVDNRNVRVSGRAWVEVEHGEIARSDSWLWMSIRYNAGRRETIQVNADPNTALFRFGHENVANTGPAPSVKRTRTWTAPTGTEYGTEWELSDGTGVATVRALVPESYVNDPRFLRLSYWEGYCEVIVGGAVVGHAWVEQVVPGWDNPDREMQLLAQAMMGDADAIGFVKLIGQVSQAADDFVDESDPAMRQPWTMSEMLSMVAFDLQKNPFYVKHRADLDPVLEMCLLYWEASNDWAKHPAVESRMWGFVLREIMEMAVARAALIVGGREHARSVIRGMHEYYHVENGEDFTVWGAKNNG